MNGPGTSGKVVMGINTAHDASVCVLVDGRLVVAVNEERLTRAKHHEGFPRLALDYCLRAVGVSLAEVACIVINEYPQTDFALEFADSEFAGEIFVNPSHHLLHAYYAWVGSGFNETAILIVDGSGYNYAEYARRGRELLGDEVPDGDMDEAETWFVARNGQIELVRKTWGAWEATSPYYRFPSLGHMYSAASQYIFGHFQHAGKTMGLAPFGDADGVPGDLVTLADDGVTVDTQWMTRLPVRSERAASEDQTCLDLSAKVQAELERAILHICQKLHGETGVSHLAVSGGVGLNSVTNGRVLRESPFTRFFVTPAASDAGVAIGAALYGHHRLTGELPQWDYGNDYHGRSYTDAEILHAAAERDARIRLERVPDPAAAAAADVAAGKVIGWFEGGSEFGPRSLGHRSILADPRPVGMRDHLNKRVKFREAFRPYAASVLVDHVEEYFAMEVADPFMLIVADVREEHWDSIPSVCHVDRTCRIQTVNPGRPDRFGSLLEHFYGLTGMPMVLNTSFNIRGEPIVETPGDAMDCFLASNIDELYVEGFRVHKQRLDTSNDTGSLIPHLNDGLVLSTSTTSSGGAAQPVRFIARVRTGHQRTITRDQHALLGAVDGASTVSSIAEVVGAERNVALAEFGDLQRLGLVSFALQET